MMKKPSTLTTGDQPRRQSGITTLADRIRQATEWLVTEHNYSLAQLANLTGGGDRGGHGSRRKDDFQRDRLHTNSIIKIKDLRIGYAVRQPKPKHPKQRHWVEAKPPKTQRQATLQGGRYQWMWSPQVDTFQRLELIVEEAVRLGFKFAPIATPEPSPAQSADLSKLQPAASRRARAAEAAPAKACAA